MRFQRCSAALCFLAALFVAGCGDDSGTGPAAPYDLASSLKGGISYDLFWHPNAGFNQADPLIATFNARGDFFRCKQCHGWDQLGTAGSYISRRATTSRPNISSLDLAAFAQASTPQRLFDAIKTGSGATRRAPTVDLMSYNPAIDPTIGDQMPDYGAFMSDEQIWNLVRFLKEDAFDVRDLYALAMTGTYPTGSATFSNLGMDGNATTGKQIYATSCEYCHGFNGKALLLEGNSLGVFTRGKPQEVQHKIRYGRLGSIMQPTRLTLAEMKDLYKYLADSVAMPR